MTQMMTKLLWKTYKKQIHIYLFAFFALIGLCFVQFADLQPEKNNFWIWQLYLNSDLYTAIVGLPLIFSIGNQFISTLFFSNTLAILRFKDKVRLFKYRLLAQSLYLLVFAMVMSLLGVVISILSTDFNSGWTAENIKQYAIIFSTAPYLEMTLITQVIFTTINFLFYLFFLMNLHQAFRIVLKERVAIFLIVGFIFLQSFLYKMDYQSQLFFLMPIYHYQASNVKEVLGNVIYWLSSNFFLIILNYFLSIKFDNFD
ncbi:hypothetical protein ACVRWQ_02365 [Streptococcus phocae subsp. salmonis]